ncbi:Crp family transcriptional regulator [Sphingobium sp. SYK-6]|uniref:Crp/Fnr family transcriptional regulator n=1 Tax=Sphingobium sp. (strain NBRC 103272 / SYK-6) TaxID=627192 RepID=UPI00022769AD|nr:Crp/Fnr family transcriptional regulator [Sphingobium sp. SYK-6]BAK65377.1 Crp family transcriptional regulator [Sphingobium sp. SYK-6]
MAVGAILQCDEATARLLLADALCHVRVAAKEVLAQQGAALDHNWLVVDGRVRVQTLRMDGQWQQLAQHGPGEFFGAYPAATTCRGEIVAVDDCHLLRAEARTIAALAAKHAQIGAALAILLARQLDRALDRMAARTTYSAAGRVYALLMELADEDNRISPPPQVTTLALSANTTRETASRAIAILSRRGIISRDDDAIIILAPRMLRDMIN